MPQRWRPPAGPVDVPASARRLVAGLLSQPCGQITPSVYETARLVRLAPWLPRHANRVRFLLDAQRADGGWGGPDGYGLVPTLSATDALLHLLAEAPALPEPGVRRERLAGAARHGLALLAAALGRPARLAIPDTPAVELIVPSLVTSLNARVNGPMPQPTGTGDPLAGPDAWPSGLRLHLPAGLDGTALATVRARLAAAAVLPVKLLHSLEVAGHAATDARLPPPPTEMIGASPAATAAWLGAAPAPGHPSVRFLAEIVRRYDGPVPSVLPIGVFERAWVVSGLVSAGIDVPMPAELVRGLADSVADSATSGGIGLPPDADTTGTVLYTLGRLGIPTGPGCLWPFEMASHFCTWQGERTPSTTTNAHVLDALGAGVTAEKVSGWLCEQQLPDGSWVDKWHASPYYATTCCALALDRYGGAASTTAVDHAIGFILGSQREDGSWGRWAGTLEETAYALQVLLTAGHLDRAGTMAAARGYAYLRQARDLDQFPPLWHDKDLYTPLAVVRVAILVALHMGQERPDIVTPAR